MIHFFDKDSVWATTFLSHPRALQQDDFALCASTRWGRNLSCVARLHIKQTADAAVYPTEITSLHKKLMAQVTSQDDMCVCW